MSFPWCSPTLGPLISVRGRDRGSGSQALCAGGSLRAVGQGRSRCLRNSHGYPTTRSPTSEAGALASLRHLVRIAIASSSMLAAEAGARLAEAGGNAVDAALAAAIVAATTEPGVSSLGGGGFITVWPPGGAPETIDGYAEMPGRGGRPEQLGKALVVAEFPYGGGVKTMVGHGAVAAPGSPAALELAHSLYGKAAWSELFGPALSYARDGFPMPPAAYRYLITSYDAIYGAAEQSVLDATGSPAQPGTPIVIPDLLGTLEALASEGTGILYRGELAARIDAEIQAHDGLLSARDLASYEATRRAPLKAELGGWTLATNPPPAIGGATLAAMLLLAARHGWREPARAETARMIDIQAAVLSHRRSHMDTADDLTAEVSTLLEAAASGDPGFLTSGSTSHTSAVDAEGLACSVTVSMGYGAGVVPPGTGLWMNNHLGELELNKAGIHAKPPGTRLASNMAPTVGRHPDGGVLAIGTPGADRIATATMQVLVNLIEMGMEPQEAIDAPRIHVEGSGKDIVVVHEPGVSVPPQLETRAFQDRDMFFGGVALATKSPSGTLEPAADPRREGSTALL